MIAIAQLFRGLKKETLAILLLALLVRTLYAGWAYSGYDLASLQGDYGAVFPHTPDSPRYELPALNLLEGQGYTQDSVRGLSYKRETWGPEIARPPGYALFLAMVYGVLGHHPILAGLLQLLLDALIAVIVCLLAHMLSGRTGALLAGVLYAVNLRTTSLAALIMSEGLFTPLLVLVALALVFGFESRRLRWFVALAILIASAAYVRPVAMYVPLFVLPAFMWSAWTSDRRSPIWWTLTCLLVLLLLAPWVWRNHRVTGHAMFSTLGHWGVGLFYAPRLIALATGVPETTARARILTQAGQYWATTTATDLTHHHFVSQAYTDPEFCIAVGKIGRQKIVSHIWAVPALVIRGLPTTLFGGISELRGKAALRALLPSRQHNTTPPDMTLALTTAAVVANWWLVTLVALGGALVGLWSTFRKGIRSRMIALWGILLGNLAFAGLAAYYRYSAPIFPLLCMLSAPGLQQIADRIRQQHHERRVEIDQI